MLQTLQQIMNLAEKRIQYLNINGGEGWYHGSISHFDGMFHELEEARIELEEWNHVYLEDELGDVFWDYLCFLEWLEQEGKIDKKRVMERCYKKFSERLGPDASGTWWNEIKKRQKMELEEEQKSV